MLTEKFNLSQPRLSLRFINIKLLMPSELAQDLVVGRG
jgi:hypothetical protein